jgi:hypothetical protein
VQLAGGVASNLAGLLGTAKNERRAAAAAGAAAGLAAAVNTPIAAVTFVLEEIIGDLNSRLLGRLGRTPVRLYDPEAAEPTLLRPGDRVRMRPIDRAEYEAIAARVAARTYTPAIA